MTIGLVGFLVPDERARSHEIAHCRNHFADLARVFGADLKLVDAPGVGEHYPETVADLETALAAFPGCAVVQMMRAGSVHLAEFEHPIDNVVYVSGPDNGAEIPLIAGARTVTVADDILWAHQVLTAAMWDRAVKLGTWRLL
jgi:hypothetical protein